MRGSKRWLAFGARRGQVKGGQDEEEVGSEAKADQARNTER